MTVENPVFDGQPGGEKPSILTQLSDVQLRALQLLAAGFAYKTIGTQLGCTQKTLRHRFTRLYDRLAVTSGVEAALMLANGGLLDDQLITQRLDLKRFKSLSKRQRDVLETLIEGHGQANKQIAQTLVVSTDTVRGHLFRLNKKLGVSGSMTRAGVVIGYWLYKKGLDEDTIALTAQETEIFRLAALGFGNREIATRVGLAYSTVKNHMSEKYTKLGVGGREEAVLRLINEGKLNLGELVGNFDLSTFDSLTPKQHRFIDALLEGSARQSTRTRTIAGRLGCASSTIKNNLTEIYRSLGINELTGSRARLVVLALAYKQKPTDTGSGIGNILTKQYLGCV